LYGHKEKKVRRFITSVIQTILPRKLIKEDKIVSTHRIHNDMRNGYTSVAGKYQRKIYAFVGEEWSLEK